MGEEGMSRTPLRRAADGRSSTPATRAVLFDLDDTLFDHRNSARAALAGVHRTHAGDVDFDLFEQHHMHHLEVLHQEVLAGRLSIDDARRERFRRIFREVGRTLDAAAVEAVASAYRRGYMAGRRVLEGAVELVQAVRPHARIAVVTNNLADEQRDKLAFCGLTALVDELIVSEEAGTAKPDPAIFALALHRLDTAPGAAVMFGDSWAADIAGAAAAGIRAVWFNPTGKPRPAEPADVEEVRSLVPVEPLLHLLLGGKL
jgi:putative hydrolase of the HAD superfamily